MFANIIIEKMYTVCAKSETFSYKIWNLWVLWLLWLLLFYYKMSRKKTAKEEAVKNRAEAERTFKFVKEMTFSNDTVNSNMVKANITLIKEAGIWYQTNITLIKEAVFFGVSWSASVPLCLYFIC